jgi:predicted HTH transcriptional regulator
MTNHDLFGELAKSKQLLDSLEPKFKDLSFDLNELKKLSNDPFTLSVMIYKLMEERRKTNELLDSINDKFDKLMFEFKTKEMNKEPVLSNKNEFSVLSDADEKIVSFIESQGKTSSEEIKVLMNYKGLNAASQRLNKLFKEGLLRKVQAGKKVLYLPKA